MKKFLALYNAPTELMDEWMKASKADQKKGMDEWMTWQKKHEAHLVEFGNPVGKNKRVTKNGITNERNEVGGFSIVKAESHDEAAKIFIDNPHIRETGAYIEIMELIDM